MRQHFVARYSATVFIPLTLGVGIGVGVCASAGAATLTTALSTVVKTALTSFQCATTPVCLNVTNSANGGVAIVGSAPYGLAIHGISTSSSGVTGESQWSNGINGKSTTGYAVHGVSAQSNGVVGSTSGGIGAVGVLGTNTGSAGGAGLDAASRNGPAIIADTSILPNLLNTKPSVLINGANTSGDGLDIVTSEAVLPTASSPGAGAAIVTTNRITSTLVGGYVVGLEVSNNFAGGVQGLPAGDGIDATSNYGNGMVGFSGGGLTDPLGTPIAAVVAETTKGADLYLGYGAGTFEVTSDGNVNASGVITSGVRCAPTTCRAGTAFASYAPHDASPTTEDFGRAQVVNGSASVRFDAAFAATIDATKDYSVFLTPEGENRGLFVTRRTSLGFTVTESAGGRSTLTFSYRVVASPYASTAARLPVISPQHLATSALMHQAAAVEPLQRQVEALRASVAQLLSKPKPKQK